MERGFDFEIIASSVEICIVSRDNTGTACVCKEVSQDAKG